MVMPEHQTLRKKLIQPTDVYSNKDINLLTQNSEDKEENGYGKLLLDTVPRSDFVLWTVQVKATFMVAILM